MSDTPRTDAEEVYYSEIVTGRNGGLYWVRADFARKLERELRLYSRLVAAMNLAYARLTDKTAREEIGALLREIEELEKG